MAKLTGANWTVITTALVIILAFGYINIYAGYFEIHLNDGEQLAKYKEGVFKLYSGRYVVLSDYVSPECLSEGFYRRTNKVRGNKYSNLSYATDGTNHFITQDIYYSRGNLTRYFMIDDYTIKESFAWVPKNPNGRCRLRIKYSGLDKNLGELLYSKNQKIYNFETELEFGLKFDWFADKDKISMVDRYDNGNMHILTSPVTGSFEYDPEIIIKNKSIEARKTIKTEYNFDSKYEEFDNGKGKITYGDLYADSNGTTIENAKSLMNCEFCSNIKLTVQEDSKYPVKVIDYNYTTITIELKVGITEIGKSIPIEVKNKSLRLNQITKKPEEIKKSIYKENNILADINTKKRVTIPFGPNIEVIWGHGSTLLFLEEPGAETMEDTQVDETAPDTNTGSSLIFFIRGSNIGAKSYYYMKINNSVVTEGATIDGAN